MRLLASLAAAVTAAAVSCALWWKFSSETPTATGALHPTPSQPSARAATLPAPVRRPLARVAAGPPAPTFDDLAAELVDLSLRGIGELERGDEQAAAATDAEVRAVVGTILGTIADYEQRALFALTGVDADDARAQAERGAYGRLLHLGLQKLATFARGGTRAPLDRFLAALLDVMVPHRATAEVVAWLLTDAPYLGPPQEGAVLRLAELVPTYPWLADSVRRLLLTLWHNLEASGARARDQIETLALMLKDDTNAALRAAALERLVTSTERGLVEFVVRDIEDRRDRERARDVAVAAAAKLPIDQAIDVVRRLRPLAPEALILPAMELARRDEARVRGCYETLLATGAEVDLRADLVSGLGFDPTPDNVALVERAFRVDPDVGVRARALLALTANAAAALGERVVSAALDDAQLCGTRGERTGILVGALNNLARAGEKDAVERLGRRLSARRDLPPAVRAELEQLLRQGPQPSPRPR